MEAGQIITQNDINRKLFFELEKIGKSYIEFEKKMDLKIDKAEQRAEIFQKNMH